MRNTKILSIVAFILSLFVIQSCSDFNDLNNIERAEEDVELAIPLINTEFSINNFTGDDGPENFSLRLDEDDRVTLVYVGDVVRQNVSAIFPPVPFFFVELLDSVQTDPVPFKNDQRVDRAIFGETNLNVSFTSTFTEDVDVTVKIPQLTKDGEIFSFNVTVPYEGTSPVKFISDLVSVKGWTLESEESVITINYDARLSDGSRQVFEEARLSFDLIVFDYIEGYFGSEVFDIKGDFIAIGVLDNWVSGGLAFEDPKVKIAVQNSFGFPVRSLFKKMQVVTTTGESLDMVSEIIDNNVDFAYPALNEPGVVKTTKFSFTRENSNIVDLFKEKVRKVTYDIDAGANPDMDETLVGFADKDSYFLVNVDVELPLEGTIHNLVLQDTVDLDLNDLGDVTSAEFKTVIANDFPADITLQSYFFDENDVLLDSLFKERLFIPGANVDPSSGRTMPGEEVINYENFVEGRFDQMKTGKKVLVNVKINTEQASSGPLWIYNDYGIRFKVGAKLRTKL